ncbi:uncharacterized protein Fot_14560 [Forsythia ovata]|uniref:Retrotransposon gag domain-containing protein n=1 Tax=Forsythia ovata TaxID=205694 RepID=A0ABD1W6Z4_9LAMI
MPDAIMCRAFLPNLRHQARDWVATLPGNSIRTLDDFSRRFATYFSSSKQSKKTIMGLMKLVQEKDEPFKDSIDRFNPGHEGLTNVHCGKSYDEWHQKLLIQNATIQKSSQLDPQNFEKKHQIHRHGVDNVDYQEHAKP